MGMTYVVGTLLCFNPVSGMGIPSFPKMVPALEKLQEIKLSKLHGPDSPKENVRVKQVQNAEGDDIQRRRDTLGQ